MYTNQLYIIGQSGYVRLCQLYCVINFAKDGDKNENQRRPSGINTYSYNGYSFKIQDRIRDTTRLRCFCKTTYFSYYIFQFVSLRAVFKYFFAFIVVQIEVTKNSLDASMATKVFVDGKLLGPLVISLVIATTFIMPEIHGSDR